MDSLADARTEDERQRRVKDGECPKGYAPDAERDCFDRMAGHKCGIGNSIDYDPCPIASRPQDTRHAMTHEEDVHLVFHGEHYHIAEGCPTCDARACILARDAALVATLTRIRNRCETAPLVDDDDNLRDMLRWCREDAQSALNDAAEALMKEGAG